MDTSTVIFNILMITIPSVIVFLAAYFTISSFLEAEREKKRIELQMQNRQSTLPLRLQAYERFVVFLERLSPNNLVFRVHESGMTAREFQTSLLQTIRSEYEHNISQQLYISIIAFQNIHKLKEETVRMINNAANGLPQHALGMDLAKIIMEHMSRIESDPYQNTLFLLKTEAAELF
ncbi:MAG: hypothetical protein LH629_01875 [Ignavibacteria bacterium]|nr:hypothetical protein [Ignavibacteria bacterium]